MNDIDLRSEKFLNSVLGLGDSYSQEEMSVMSSIGQLAFGGMMTQSAGFVVRMQAMLSFSKLNSSNKCILCVACSLKFQTIK